MRHFWAVISGELQKACLQLALSSCLKPHCSLLHFCSWSCSKHFTTCCTWPGSMCASFKDSCRQGRLQPSLQSSTQSCQGPQLALCLQEYLTHAPVPADKQADLTNRKGKK